MIINPFVIKDEYDKKLDAYRSKANYKKYTKLVR